MTAGPARRRMLHVFSTFGAGGPQVRMTQIAQRMGDAWQHDIIALDGDVAASRRFDAGVAFELLPPPPRRSFGAGVMMFWQLLAARPFDLLLTYNWGSIECVAAARLRRIRRHVHHEDGFGPGEQVRRHWRRNWMRRLALARGVEVIVPSTRLLTIARCEWRLGARALHLPNGVDAVHFAPAPSRSTGPFTIGTVGGLRGEKDHATLLRAVASMQQSVQVRLVGDGPERRSLEDLAQQLGIGARVVFVGAVTDTAPEYRGLDLFVLSSRTEQMPISLLEAMASGLAVVSTDVGDVRVMLPTVNPDRLVSAGDPMALARALDRAVADRERLRGEGERNRTRCLEQYELGRCLDRYATAYERALGRHCP